MTEQTESCCQCGMEKDFWATKGGFDADGGRYCCDRCAEETGCRCEANRREALAASRPRKAPRRIPTSPFARKRTPPKN